MTASTNTPSNSVLASIFVLSLLLMFLIPYTLSRIFSRRTTKQVAVKRVSDTQSQWGRAAAAQAVKQPSGLSSRFRGMLSPGNVCFVLAWLLAIALLVHVRSAAEEVRPFDPFDILGVTTSATDKEIKRAYRQLSLKFHPDKNPDPAASSYFAEFISPAYKALTDETAKANLAKHGHPDGPQGMSVGVALPAFLFEKGRAAPLVLGGIVGVGILLPLAAVVCYITRQAQYTSSNILQRTLYTFFHLTEQKNSLTTSKVAEILICSNEYLSLPVRRTDEEPLQKLTTELRGELDVKDPKFQKLHPPCKKALILLHAQLARQGAAVPEALQADFLHVLGLAPTLLDELLKLMLRPRPPFGYSWLRPVLSALEYNQCLTQALPVGSRQEKTGLSDGSQSLMQLPHIDVNGVKKLNRSKIRSLQDLLLMADAARDEALKAVDLTAGQRKDFDEFLSAMPCVTLDATCETEGEEGGEILEGDLATCSVHLSLERLSATDEVHTPFFPGEKEENWWVLLADVSSNALLAVQKVSLSSKGKGLTKFRAAAAKAPAPGSAAGSTATPRPGGEPASAAGTVSAAKADGDLVLTLKFRAPPAGLHLLQVMCVSDYWVGCDRVKPLKLKVGKMARAEQKKRNAHMEDQASDNSEGGQSDADGEAHSSDSENQAEENEDDLTESGTSDSSGEDE